MNFTDQFKCFAEPKVEKFVTSCLKYNFVMISITIDYYIYVRWAQMSFEDFFCRML